MSVCREFWIGLERSLREVIRRKNTWQRDVNSISSYQILIHGPEENIDSLMVNTRLQVVSAPGTRVDAPRLQEQVEMLKGDWCVSGARPVYDTGIRYMQDNVNDVCTTKRKRALMHLYGAEGSVFVDESYFPSCRRHFDLYWKQGFSHVILLPKRGYDREHNRAWAGLRVCLPPYPQEIAEAIQRTLKLWGEAVLNARMNEKNTEARLDQVQGHCKEVW